MASRSALRLSVLDQSPVPEGSSASVALRNSIDLARLCDELGYHRYWLAEHHGTPALACGSPEALIGPLAAATSRIRVGSGGIMLPHYSALKVAETFSLLESLYPGRIDLGIGRAAGTSPAVAFALQRDRRQAAPDDFYDQLLELLGYIGHQPNETAPMLGESRKTAAASADLRKETADSSVAPRLASAPFALSRVTAGFHFEHPEAWLLGSSPQSAIWAAQLGLPYVFADFINPAGAEIASYYRDHFIGSDSLSEPRMAVAVWAVCAGSKEEAERLSLSARMMLTLLHRGMLIPVPTVERARRFFEDEGLPPQASPFNRRIIAGTPDMVRSSLEAVARDYEAKEVLVVNILHDHGARRHCYELLASAFQLSHDALANPELTPMRA